MSPQRHFQEELDRLKSMLLAMAGRAEDAVRLAVEALLERDRARADAVIAGDQAIDTLELDIDDTVIEILARYQPMARDLRLIIATINICTGLERVGDHAVNIAEETEDLLASPPFPPLPEIEEMVRLAGAMLSDALDAFVREDAALARDVLRRDDRVDDLNRNVFRILLTHMMEDPRKIGAGMDLLLVSGNLERIADLATNIAEEVIFLVEGRLVKHHAEEREARSEA